MKGQIAILAGVGIIILVALVLANQSAPTFCAQDVLQCGDGTYVSRNPARACGFDPCPGNFSDYSTIVNTLRRNHTVELLGATRAPFMPVEGQAFRVKLGDGSQDDFQAYEFQDAQAASDFAALISPDAETINGTTIDWVSEPHFYRSGKIVVVYIGSNAGVASALSSVAGKPIAGSGRSYVAYGDSCDTVRFLCVPGSEYFRDNVGCGCQETSREYVSNDPNECRSLLFTCDDGKRPFFDDNGCGCEPSNKQTYCEPDSRNVEACLLIYKPVCGWFDPSQIQCIRYPCAQTFGNNCQACSDEKVLYYTDGECPA